MSPKVRKFQVALTLIGMSGIVLSFVPFAYDQIPAEVFLFDSILSSLWALVAPCVLLPVAVSTAYAVWLIKNYLPRWLEVSNYAFATLSVCAILSGLGIEGPYETELITMFLLFIIACAGAAWLSIRGTAHSPEIRSVVAMQAVYFVPMSFWVAFAQTDFQIGAWLGVVTLLTYLAQIALQVKHRLQMLAVIIPIISIILTMTFTRQFW